MALLVLSIGFLQNLLDLLADVLNLLNESGGFVDRRLIRGVGCVLYSLHVCVCGCVRYDNCV
jgi:hypothetical protein